MRAFASSIGVDTSDVSLLDLAQEFGTNSVTDMVQAAKGSPDPANENFTVLPIDLMGTGVYRADRFRIYFRRADLPMILPMAVFVSELDRLFPRLFSGVGAEVDNLVGLNGQAITQNIARAFYRRDKPFNGEPTIQFIADLRVLFNELNAPDLHDDWVGFIHQDPNRGFAVQTLKRKFTQDNDVIFGALTGGVVAAVVAALYNRSHFLCGRRSWVFGRAIDVRGARFAEAHPVGEPFQNALNDETLYVFETAAIDRFSSWVYELLGTDPDSGGFLPIDDQTADVWTVLLSNFVTFTGNVRTPVNAGLHPTFGLNQRRGVHFIQANFSSESECLAQDWVQDSLDLHPGLAAQF